MANITLKNISVGPIKGLDLSIGDREFVVLAGPSNSGASSLVRLIAGLQNASHGDILFDDRPINNLVPSDRDVALLAHDYVPYPNLSVFENLAIGLRRRNFAETEIGKRITEVGNALGLEGQLHSKTEALSLEQQRLIGLARAMVRQPKVYLFNEPFADLGATAIRFGRAEIVKLHQRSSATIAYATSRPLEALAFCQRTVVLIDGAIQQDGPAPGIYESPANLAVAKFFDDPPMNLVRGTIKQDRNRLVFSEAGDGTMAIPLATAQASVAKDLSGKEIVMGFWPEDVDLEDTAEAGKQGEASFRALVERVEPVGFEAKLYLQTGAHAVIARIGWSDRPVEGGRRLQFRVRAEKTHLFDAKSGLRIG
jgi:multiple sugar transport system ATP-binding protein